MQQCISPDVTEKSHFSHRQNKFSGETTICENLRKVMEDVKKGEDNRMCSGTCDRTYRQCTGSE